MTKSQDYINSHRWLASIIITLLGCVAIKIIPVLLEIFYAVKFTSVPYTFHTVWELLALGLIVYIVKHFGVNVGNFIFYIFIGTVITFLAYEMLLPKHLQPYALLKKQSNYFAFTPDKDDIGDGPRQIWTAGYLYQKDNPVSGAAVNSYRVLNGNIKTDDFLFWQTGLARGFNPVAIPNYNGGKTFLNKLELTLTVGPIEIMEFTLVSVSGSFLPLMLMQFVWFRFRKKHIWWDRWDLYRESY